MGGRAVRFGVGSDGMALLACAGAEAVDWLPFCSP